MMGDQDEVLSNNRPSYVIARQLKRNLRNCTAKLRLFRTHAEIHYENARFAINQDEFNEQHQGYMEQHRITTERIAELEDQRRNRQINHGTGRVYTGNRDPPACDR